MRLLTVGGVMLVMWLAACGSVVRSSPSSGGSGSTTAAGGGGSGSDAGGGGSGSDAGGGGSGSDAGGGGSGSDAGSGGSGSDAGSGGSGSDAGGFDTCGSALASACFDAGGYLEYCNDDVCTPDYVTETCNPRPVLAAGQFACGAIACNAGQFCGYGKPEMDGCSNHTCFAVPVACAGTPNCTCIDMNPQGWLAFGSNLLGCTEDAAGNATVTYSHL
jgi:hypothetical protein